MYKFSRCDQGKHPLMNAIKNGLLDPHIDSEPIRPDPIRPEQAHPDPVIDPPNSIEDDLDDIEVRPGYTKPSTTHRPMKQSTRPMTMKPPKTTTMPSTIEEERYKVVCYYTNWAWYR